MTSAVLDKAAADAGLSRIADLARATEAMQYFRLNAIPRLGRPAPDGLLTGLAGIAEDHGYEAYAVPAIEGSSLCDGVTETGPSLRRIRIAASGRSGLDQCRVLAHELGHVVLGHQEPAGASLPLWYRETEAEGISYLVMAGQGVPGDKMDIVSGSYLAPYLALAGRSPHAVISCCAPRILEAARYITGRLKGETDRA